MKQCASCQAEMVENSRFCMKCGTPNPDYRPGGPPAEATVAVPHSGPPTQTLVAGTAGIEKTEMIQDSATRPPLAGQRTEVLGPAGRTEVVPATLPPQPAVAPTMPPQPAAKTEMVPDAALRTSVPGSKDEISKIFETSGVCPNCYAPLKKGSSQCEECGYRLTGNYCASCGKAIEDGAKFCPNCKTAVPAASPTVTTPAAAGTGVMSAATVVTPAPASGALGATIVSGSPAPLGATVIAAPPAAPGLGATVAVPPAAAGLGATVAAGVPAAPPAAPRKGFPVALALVLGFVLLVVLGVGGWAAWKFLISKKTDTGKGTGVVETTSSTTGATTTTGGATGTQTDLTGTGGLSGFGGQTEDLIGEAQQYYNSGNYARALEAVERHLQNHKDDSGAYFFAARICREMGKTEEAKNYLLTALSYNPDNADAHLELGKLYSNAGFSDKAVEQFREAVRLAPDNQEAAWLLAKEFERLGDKENARKAAGQYVQNFPAGQYRAEADAMLAARTKTGTGRTGAATGTASGGETYAGGGTTVTPPPPPPPPSPYVDIVLDGTALNLPGMVAGVDVMIGGASRKFGPGANMRLDNIEKGSQEYTVRVTYFNASTNEQESTYSGSGSIDIRYPNQKIYVKRIGNRVILQ